jgi:hypothetical protein
MDLEDVRLSASVLAEGETCCLCLYFVKHFAPNTAVETIYYVDTWGEYLPEAVQVKYSSITAALDVTLSLLI